MPPVRPASLLAVVLATTLAGSASADGVYAGWLRGPGEDDTLVVRTDSAGTTPHAFVIAFRATCDDGFGYAYHRTVRVGAASETPDDVIVASDTGPGGFSATYTGSSATETLTFAETGTITGTFARGHADGTLDVVLRGTDTETGELVTTCRTHARHWRAVRGPRVFGGTTSQGEPVTMILRKGGRAVREFDFGWHSSCDTGDFVDVPDYITNFPIIRHRFGASFPYVDDVGNSATYAFAGRLSGRRASGTVTVDIETVWGARCDTGRLHWSARSS